MTQKSLGRRRKDAMAAELAKQEVVSPYVELAGLYRSQKEMFPQYSKMVQLVAHPEIIPFLQDITHTNNLVKTLSADVVDLHQRLEAQYKLHAHKTAMPNAIDEDENFEIIQHFQTYQMFMGVHTQTIVPVMFELDEHLQYAIQAKSAAQSANIAEGAAAAQTDQTLAQASAGVHLVQRGGQSSMEDAQGNPVPHNAAPSMADYEAAVTIQ